MEPGSIDSGWNDVTYKNLIKIYQHKFNIFTLNWCKYSYSNADK